MEDIVVTPDGENTWRIISGHRRVMAAELPPASAQARPGRQSSADGGFLWPGRPPLHRAAEGAGSLRRRGPHHRPEKAGHLPCQSGGAAANGGGPESRPGRLISSPAPRRPRRAKPHRKQPCPVRNRTGHSSCIRPVATDPLSQRPALAKLVPSRFMRKIVYRLRLSEVSQQ